MKKIRGSTLMLTVVVALILSIICSCVILLAYFNRGYQSDMRIREKLNRNVNSGINMVLADSSFSDYRVDTVDLFGNEEDSLIITRGAWGLFQTATVQAFQQGFAYQRSFMYGAVLPDYMHGCLYLADHKSTLSVVGKTKLIGDAYLSKAGIRSGYISQRGFDFDRMIEGKVLESEEQLPALHQGYLSSVQHLLNDVSGSAHQNNIAGSFSSDSLTQHFNDTVLTLSFSGELVLKNQLIHGKAIIFCDSIIVVEASAALQNSMLVAPVIKFMGEYKGIVQAFALDSIVTEAGCTFNYPSAFVIIKGGDNTLQPNIRIGENCFFNGILLSSAKTEDLYKTSIELGKGSMLNGIIYCQGYSKIKGNINGVVLTDYFIHKTDNTAYDNYLADVEINRLALSKYFLGSSIFHKIYRKNIVQWLE